MNENKEHRVTLRLPEELYQEIETFTSSSGMSITEFLRRACREKLDHMQTPALDTVDNDRLKQLIREVLAEGKIE